MAKKAPTITVPKTLGACADRLFEIKALKKDPQAIIDRLDEERKAIEDHLINNLPKSAAEGITGKLARATIKSKELPIVEDWDELYKYIAKKKAWDLLQRRLSNAAVEERLNNGESVPGTGIFTAISVSVTQK